MDNGMAYEMDRAGSSYVMFMNREQYRLHSGSLSENLLNFWFPITSQVPTSSTERTSGDEVSTE